MAPIFPMGFMVLVLALLFALFAGPASGRVVRASISSGGTAIEPRGKSSETLAPGKFLVARGFMRDPNFSGTVIYLLKYNLQGALGVIVNRPTEIMLSDALPHIDWLKDSPIKLFLGGPVERTKLILLALSKEPIEGAMRVRGNLYMGWDVNLFREFFNAQSGDISAVRAYGGYAGWAPGQLAGEVERGGWRVIDADEAEIFRDTSRLWFRLMGRQ